MPVVEKMKGQAMSLGFFRILLGLLPFLLVSIAHGNDLPEPINLSLKQAMAMAIRNNLDLRDDALDSSIAESYLERSRGIYDPYLSLTGNYGQTYYTGETYGTNDTTTAFGLTQYLPSGGSLTAATQTGYSTPADDLPNVTWRDWYTSVGLTISQPLLKNFGKETTELNISLATNAHEDSLEQFRISVTDTIYTVIREYNRLYTLRQVLQSRLNSLQSARNILEKVKQQGKGRELQDVEIANTEYTISQRLKDLVDAERLIKDQEARLRYLIGMESKITLIPVDPPSREEPLETIDQAVSLALEHRSDLKQLHLDLQSSELQERVAKSQLLPNLSVNVGGGFRGIDDRFSDSIGQITDGKGRWWTAGLQFSVPLGNSVAESDYRRNTLQTNQLKYRLASFEWRLRDYIEADMRALISARVQKQVADRSVKIAELRVEQYRKSVVRKTSQVQDLLNAENDLINAQDNQTEALEDFANAVALLWKDAGVLLERMNIHIDTRQPEKITERSQQSIFPTTAAVPQQPLLPKESQVRKGETAAETAVYTLNIGEYLSSELDAITKKVIIAGLVPQVTTGTKQSRQVIRLNAGDYQSYEAAQTERQKLLHDAGSGVFILKKGKATYRLYVGTHLSRNSALKEQQRLAALGINLTLEEASVLLPTSLLTAGRFSSREAALAGALKLEKLGVKSVVQGSN